MHELLTQYGLAAVFLCALVETDITFILTGVIIHLGIVSPLAGLTAGVTGALMHDSIWFGLGLWRSESIRGSRVYRRIAPVVEQLANRFGPWELFLCRFIYGTRNPSLVFWGVHRLALPKFALIEITALSLWGTLMTTLGYLLSSSAAALFGKVKSLERWLLGAVILTVLWFFAARLFTKHEIKKLLPPPDE